MIFSQAEHPAERQVGQRSLALLLFMGSQRFVGPLAALGHDSQGGSVFVVLLATAYVILVPGLYKGSLAGPAT